VVIVAYHLAFIETVTVFKCVPFFMKAYMALDKILGCSVTGLFQFWR